MRDTEQDPNDTPVLPYPAPPLGTPIPPLEEVQDVACRLVGLCWAMTDEHLNRVVMLLRAEQGLRENLRNG